MRWLVIYGEGLELDSWIGGPVTAPSYLRYVMDLLPALHTEEAPTDSIPPQLPPVDYISEQDDDCFDELIGLRIHGHPHLLLAAVRFNREDGALVEYGRESLPFYLSHPHQAGNAGDPGSMVVVLPEPDEPIPDFLAALRNREERAAVRVDPSHIRFAFDFRTVNPCSLSKIRPVHVHPRPTAFRTTEGHVLVGATKDLSTRLREGREFLVLLNPVQRTEGGTHMLPTLIVHRSFIAATAEAPALADERSLERLLPFRPTSAVPRPLLS